MNAFQKTAGLASVAAILAVVAYLRIHENIIVNRFRNEVDPKIARKANREMMRRALTGAYEDADLDDDADFDRIFLTIVKDITNP